MPGVGAFGLRGINANNVAAMIGLPRLDTSSIPTDLSSGLRTAPPYGGFGAEFDAEMMGYGTANSSTINPHELHTSGLQGLGIDGSADFGSDPYSGLVNSQAIMDDDGSFDWMAHGFEQQMTFMNAAENAIESSPSAMDTNSPATFHDVRPGSQTAHIASKMDNNIWQQSITNHQHSINSPMSMDVNALFADMPASSENTISPKSLLAQNNPGFDVNFSTPPDLSSVDLANIAAMSNGTFSLPFKYEPIASTASTASGDSSMRHSSITTNCGELVTEHMRSAVISSLSQFSGFGQRRQSAPVVSSPLTPGGSTKSKTFNPHTFPSTPDLQRYVSAYFRFCHPHLPFLHPPTLNFESAEYATPMGGSGTYAGQSGNTIGGSCLLLSIVAMGALYENEPNVSKELFEYAKRSISYYLEGRRKTSASRNLFVSHHNMENDDTPLWLVQAMLLNVVYGHNCGDKTAADIASNHCAALVSLARGAELAKPYALFVNNEGWNGQGNEMVDLEWLEWKTSEERKRTLYSIFVLSSMLVMAYNRAPALTNSEIRLDLPCDEELWAAENATAWRALGGTAAVQSRSIPFAGALTHLLTAAQREKQASETSFSVEGWHQVEAQTSVLKPSSFGCLVLIDALHNYIWETRQRHLGRQWTPQEVDAMHAHIEPALRAWSAAWSSNPLHVIERPNPFGAGPLPADSIPLLDLAYVRLFVDFGRSKEAYWQRDYDSMAQELAKGPETGYVANPEQPGNVVSPSSQSQRSETNSLLPSTEGLDFDGSNGIHGIDSKPTRRERHLRKAAFYAADHLVNADRLGVAFAEKTSRDLPMQSILCACDSAQVLSEWVTTLQERVGKYIGVIGRDDFNMNEVPAVLLLDEEDRKLLCRIEELLASAEQKSENVAALHEARKGGYGSRILVLTSQTMARAAVWPVTRLMSQSLEIQAAHVTARVQESMQPQKAALSS
ncbi:hypothetical protein H2198_006537 [Neophaeococcomyces mojaviensis]|uniref:Uncharacterized protein n=1 Tax=Neophaeococcomyces mojaviensis TaxID=3383035 RepID=A0ACC3A314_9EURO|nr:hypothetical protein H2198_006537 [Knufia sp. JES_112]